MKNLCYYFKRIKLLFAVVLLEWLISVVVGLISVFYSTPFDIQNLKNMLQYNYLFNGKIVKKKKEISFITGFFFSAKTDNSYAILYPTGKEI